VIILDTNVVSEIIRREPAPAVIRWVAAQEPTTVFTTAVTEAEMLAGAELLPPGQRRLQLTRAIAAIFTDEFPGRILPFGSDVAPAYALIVANRTKAGRPISQFDAMIAAIARTVSASIATRNTADFADCGVQVVNPWTAA
jgi:predicted nucleic acid-binding protein